MAGGTFLAGGDADVAYPDDYEGPVLRAVVAPLAIGATTVTNAEFAAFVLETGHVTDAEIHNDSLVFAGLLSKQLQATTPAVQAAPWWRQTPGATWLHPYGDPGTVLRTHDHPIVHVSQRDAAEHRRPDDRVSPGP